MSRFYLKMEKQSSLRNVVFWKNIQDGSLDKDKTMDNVQKHNISTVIFHYQEWQTYLRKELYHQGENVHKHNYEKS
jgi:hypothetical protein